MWIKIKINQPSMIIMSIYDIIDHELSNRYNLQRFLADYRYIIQHKRSILPYDEEDDLLECNIESCYITKRTERNKSNMTRNNQERNRLFFIKNTNDEDVDLKDIVIQNILDTLHTFIYHTIRIDFRKYIKYGTRESDDDEAEDEQDGVYSDKPIVISCFDEGVRKLSEIIEQKKQRSNRYKATNTRYTTTNNKFVTKTSSQYQYEHQNVNQNMTSSDDAPQQIAISQSDAYGNNQQQNPAEAHYIDEPGVCFMDYLANAINENRSKLNQEIVTKFEIFLRENDYETDSICDDMNNNPESNIINNTKNYKKENDVLMSILNRFVYIQTTHSISYSAGYRFFYWDYYRNLNQEWNILRTMPNGQASVEGNSGYMIKDWYIPKKYNDLREELTSNAIYQFPIRQFNNIQNQSTIKLHNLLNDADAEKQFKAQHGYPLLQFYGIMSNAIITVQHIMSLLFYTNFSSHSAAFSATFRREHGFETDESLKARNREYWHWSRLLRECVECYGQGFGNIYRATPTLWHGVSAELIFDSTFIRLYGPFSTTAGKVVFLYALFFCSIFVHFILSLKPMRLMIMNKMKKNKEISRSHMIFLAVQKVLFLILWWIILGNLVWIVAIGVALQERMNDCYRRSRGATIYDNT